MSDGGPLLAVHGLGKSYAAPVLSDFDFELRAGEVHALVGANGAGKSTFVRLVSGLALPDGGRMERAGRAHAPRSRREAEEAGVVIVLQELNILPTLTVGENLFLDRLPRRAGWIQQAELRRLARAALERVGLGTLDPDTPAGGLGVGEQQLLEIARALARRCDVLILDEPTAALTAPEVERLFANIRALQAAGVGIIYITHRMDEVRRIADRVSVLRDGRRIVTRRAAETDPAELMRDMIGATFSQPARANRRASDGEVALRIEDLRAGARVRGVSFDVRRGEILGLAGLVGSGRTETVRAIFGADRRTGGDIFLGGKTQPARIRYPHDAVRLGIGLIPEDRKKDGLLLSLSVAANAGLAVVARDAMARCWIDPRADRRRAEAVCAEMGVSEGSLARAAGELSGGNQQKVVLARWLLRDCAVLLVDEPTRGIDLAAKQRIYELLRALAANGKAIVVVSSETPELFALCDRIVVMSAGRIAGEFAPEEWSEAAILRAAFSGYVEAAATPAES